MNRPATGSLLIQLSCALNNRLTNAAFLLVMVLILPISILAQDPKPKDAPEPTQASTPSANEELTKLRKQVQQLSGEVIHLRAELAKLERYKTIDYTRELMLKEEQRVRDLQKELIDVGAKETALQKRLDEIEEEQRPDRIERSLAGVGLVKPEEEREAISRRLSNEKRRIQTQMDSLRASRTRIPPLIVNAEESIARLKQRLSELRAIH
jgi:predicted  nucleic acid-binding Zn-ribbon protein